MVGQLADVIGACLEALGAAVRNSPDPRRADDLTTLDQFLAEEGRLETFREIAIEEMRAWQTEQAAKVRNHFPDTRSG